MPKNPKIGICLWSVPAKDNASRIRLAHQLGIHGFEIDLGNSEQGFPMAQESVQSVFKTWRDQLGLTYTTLGVNEFCSCSMSDPVLRQRAHEAVDKAIEVAAAMEIPLLQFPSFFASEIKDAAGFGATVDCLRYACEKAGEKDILIGSENALDLANQRLLLEMVDAPNFRIYFDTANPKCMKGLSGPELLEDAYPKVGEVHLKDECEDGRPALLGQGDTAFNQSMAILNSRDYDGWMHLENNYNKLPALLGISVEEAIEKDLAYARSLFES